MKKPELTRRSFLKGTASTAALIGLAGCGAFQNTPWGKVRTGTIVKGRKLRVACIGIGGKGSSDTSGADHEEIVALCDVDLKRGEGSIKKYPNAKVYRDYRKMLLEMDDQIDAVTVSTPDHTHFPAAIMAIQMGKHVYVQKPLTHTVWEARQLTLAARRHKVVSQMGNQGHAGEGIRSVREWIMAGMIGEVKEAHIWTNRPVWPQNLERPTTVDEVPETLDWNLWLGVAPVRPYNKAYLPFNWRGWWDFGCGALGDMACHIMDAAYWGLELGNPTSIQAEVEGGNEETAPKSSRVVYEFPARKHSVTGKMMPPVTLTWSDGSWKPKKPADLEENRELAQGGQLIVGSEATVYDGNDYCNSPRLIPETKMKAFQKDGKFPEKTIPRVPQSNPHVEWTQACKGEGPMPGSNFDYAGPFTEVVVLGNLAVRNPGKKLLWDARKMRVTNDAKASEFVTKKYRKF